MKGANQLSLDAVAKAIGDESLNPQQNMYKRLKYRKFTSGEQTEILKYIFERANLLSGKQRADVGAIEDALYFAFLNFARTKETSQDNARARIEGTYKLWRYSVEHADEYVVGKIVFEEKEKTRAVGARMIQPKKSLDGVRGSAETFSGYLFRISNFYLMLLRDEINSDIRMTLFPRVKLCMVGPSVNPRSIFATDRAHIVHLDGFGLGIDGNSGFFSPVHLSLVDDVDELAKLDETLDVVPAGHEQAPARIIKKLQNAGPLRRL